MTKHWRISTYKRNVYDDFVQRSFPSKHPHTWLNSLNFFKRSAPFLSLHRSDDNKYVFFFFKFHPCSVTSFFTELVLPTAQNVILPRTMCPRTEVFGRRALERYIPVRSIPYLFRRPCPVMGHISKERIVQGTHCLRDASYKEHIVQGMHRPRTHCPRRASSKRHIVQGMHRLRDASSKGCIVQETHCPRDASSKNFRSGTHH